MEKAGKTRSGVPYQYKMNNKKRAIVDREGLESDEEEAEDLRAVEQIEEIMRTMYERKKGGPGSETEGRTPIQIIVSVEPTIPHVTNTPERIPTFRQPILVEEKQQDMDPIKEHQLWELVYEVIINCLHHAEAVVKHSSK
jgi:hypothetical protein